MLQTEIQTEEKALIESAIRDLGEIGTLPEVTVRIIHIVENPKSTARDLHQVIKVDPALSARILKVVNSAFYGLPGQISSTDRAIVLLGLSAVKNIAIAASMTQLFNCGARIEGFSGAELWRHSIAMAVAARMLSLSQGRPAVEESFLAGLIADLGMLVERQVYPKKLGEVIARLRSEGGNQCDIEREVIKADHQAFGMALAKKWRFPNPLCTTIGYHHKPMDLAPVNRELPLIVHVADLLACRAEIGFCGSPADIAMDPELFDSLKLTQEQVDKLFEQLPEQVSLAESIFRD